MYSRRKSEQLQAAEKEKNRKSTPKRYNSLRIGSGEIAESESANEGNSGA